MWWIILAIYLVIAALFYRELSYLHGPDEFILAVTLAVAWLPLLVAMGIAWVLDRARDLVVTGHQWWRERRGRRGRWKTAGGGRADGAPTDRGG